MYFKFFRANGEGFFRILFYYDVILFCCVWCRDFLNLAGPLEPALRVFN